jgi:hypothetical protein
MKEAVLYKSCLFFVAQYAPATVTSTMAYTVSVIFLSPVTTAILHPSTPLQYKIRDLVY